MAGARAEVCVGTEEHTGAGGGGWSRSRKPSQRRTLGIEEILSLVVVGRKRAIQAKIDVG